MVSKQRGKLAPKGATKLNNEMFADFSGEVMFNTKSFEQLIKQVNAKQRPAIIQYVLDFLAYLKDKLSGKKNITFELKRLESAYAAMLRDAKQKETTADNSGGVRYSITESFTDNNGNQYDNAVLLDTDFFDGLSPRNWGKKLKEYVYNRSENKPFIMMVADEKGNLQNIEFAKKNERVSKSGDNNHLVLNELIETSDNISKLSTIHIDEIIEVSEENNPYYSSENSHGWLDKNGWLHRNANVINAKNGNIYNITLDIAKTADGRMLLYATKGKIKKVGQTEVNSLKIKGSGSHSNFDNSIPSKSDTVNTNSMQNTKNYSSNDKKFSIPMLGAENDINSNFYQEYLEDMPIDEYNKLTVKKPIKVTKDIYAAVSSARMQLYGDSEVEDIPIIDIINLGEYGVLNSDDFYYIRNANKIDYSIIKHTKTLKGRKNKKDDIRRRQKGNSTYRGIDREDGRIRTERENDRSNRNNRPFADKSAPGKNAGETQFVEETDRRVGTGDSTADIGRGIEKTNSKIFSFPMLEAENNQQDSDEVERNIINEAKRLRKEYNNGKISREEYREKLNTLWADAADRFDTIPEGENATEEIPVPKKVSSAE